MLEIILALTGHALPGDWESVHPGVRYEDAPFMAAAYRNSEGDLSVALGGVWRRGDYFAELALVTGYEAAPVAPMLRVGREFENTRLFVAPAMNADGDFGVVFGLSLVLRPQ